MKDLPEQCSLQTPSHEFEFVRLMNNEMRQFLQGKCGVCTLIESLPSLSSGDIYRYAPGKLASDESKLKKVFEEMDIPYDLQFPDRDVVTFDPQFVQGPGRHHPLLVDWYHSHSFNPDGSRMLEFEESDEYPDSGECPDSNALGACVSNSSGENSAEDSDGQENGGQ